MRRRWRVRFLLLLVAISALVAWGSTLVRRGEAFRGLASREAGFRAKLLEMAEAADAQGDRVRGYAESLARGEKFYIFAADDAGLRESNRAFLAEEAAWWTGRAAEYRSQAAAHEERLASFGRVASRPWESPPPGWDHPDADRHRRAAFEHAGLEVFCREWADSNRGEQARYSDMSRKPPEPPALDRRAEFAGESEIHARQSREGLIQSDYHAAMRRRSLRAASRPGEPLPPPPPDPKLR